MADDNNKSLLTNESTDTSKPVAKNPNQIKKPTADNRSTVIANDFLPENYNPFERPKNPKFANRKVNNEFDEIVLSIKRVIKVTKGGRRFKFSALVVVGNRKGQVGYAIGKHIEVPEAIKKAARQAKKNLIDVKIVDKQKTIPHEAIGHNGAASVLLKPAGEGRGIIASNNVRAVIELAGYHNIYSKNLGTSNPQNVVLATIDALLQMRTKEEIYHLRDKTVNERKKWWTKKPQVDENQSTYKPIHERDKGN